MSAVFLISGAKIGHFLNPDKKKPEKMQFQSF